MALISPLCFLNPYPKLSPSPISPLSRSDISKSPKISVCSPSCRLRIVTCLCNFNDDPSSRAPAHRSSRIFIKELSPSTTEGFLAKTFSHFGTVAKVKIIIAKRSKQSLGFAYVWFTCEEAAVLAVEQMDGKFLDGRFVTVTLARLESLSSQRRVVPYKF